MLRLLAALAVPVVLTAVTPSPLVRSVPYPGHIFAIRVETNKQTYRLGEPIEVRVSITNLTDQRYGIYSQPAWALSGLKVVDSERNKVPVTEAQAIGRGQPQNQYRFAPRQTMTLGWMDIREFGYNLTKPGSYILSASLYGGGSWEAPDGGGENFGLSGEEKATPIAITVLK